MNSRALLIGNSDGIGLETTKRLLSLGWEIKGVSRSDSPITNSKYYHKILDVSENMYLKKLKDLISDNQLDLCIYFVGIGELLDFKNMEDEPKIVDINFTGMIKTASVVIQKMVEKGRGHFIGISSVADELLSAEAPSYHASKAGFSNYLRGLALALKSKGVKVTNIRFGFVDTKMAKGDSKPFMMSVEKAVDHIEKCMKKKPVQYTAPKIIIPLVKLRKFMIKFGA